MVTGFEGPWALKLARRRRLRFPAPTVVVTAAEAPLLESRAQTVSAECTTRGQAAAWVVPSLTATVMGAAAVAGARGAHASSPCEFSILASGVSAMILMWVGLIVTASIALPVVRDLHMRAPTWTARAQAYSRGRTAIESASDRLCGRGWWTRADNAQACRR